MNDFRTVQARIAQYQVQASADEYHLEGYTVLRDSRAAAHAVLGAAYDYDPPHGPSAPGEQEKRHLQRQVLESPMRIRSES